MSGKAGYTYLHSKLQEEKVGGVSDSDVLDMKINWEKLQSANLISQDEYDALNTYDGAPDPDREMFLKDEPDAERLANALVAVLVSTERKEVLRYVLVLIKDIIEDYPNLRVLFKKRDPDPCDVLLRMLNRVRDELVVSKAAAVVAMLLASDDSPESYLARYNTWILRKLPESRGDALVAALFSLKCALRNKKYQSLFVYSSGVSMHLTKVLRNNSNHRQVLYLTGFCLWLLSFEKKWVTSEVLIKAQLMQALVNTLNDRLKPKIVRIVLSLFENLLNDQYFRQLMVMKGLVGILETLSAVKWDDEDIPPLVEKVSKGLEKDVRALSSFERYTQELKSKQLQEGPVHTAAFWKANAKKFEKDDFSQIKDIIGLLPSQDDNETVAMACYDLGEWARFYPDGRKIVEMLGGKDRIMVLLSHDDQLVQKQALLAIQKLLVQNWESIEGVKEDK